MFNLHNAYHEKINPLLGLSELDDSVIHKIIGIFVLVLIILMFFQPILTHSASKFFNNNLIRFIAIFGSLYLVTKNFKISGLLALLISLIMFSLNFFNIIENFSEERGFSNVNSPTTLSSFFVNGLPSVTDNTASNAIVVGYTPESDKLFYVLDQFGNQLISNGSNVVAPPSVIFDESTANYLRDQSGQLLLNAPIVGVTSNGSIAKTPNGDIIVSPPRCVRNETGNLLLDSSGNPLLTPCVMTESMSDLTISGMTSFTPEENVVSNSDLQRSGIQPEFGTNSINNLCEINGSNCINGYDINASNFNNPL